MSVPRAEDSLASLAARYWQFECYESPFTAALAGEPTADAVLFREALSDYERRYNKAAEFLLELERLPADHFSGQSLATYRLLSHELKTLRRNYEVRAHLRPSLFPVGPDFNTIYFANAQSLDSLQAAELYVARLATIPEFLQDLQDNLRAGHSAGIRYPRLVLERGVATVQGAIAGPPEASSWYGPLKRSLRASEPGFSAVASRGLSLLRDEVYPAFHAYGAFLTGPLAEGARASIACTDAPDGREYYRALVSQFTTTNLDPDEIHQLGVREVERLDTEIETVARDAGYENDVVGYRKFLAGERSFYAPTAETLRQQLQVLAKRVDRHIPTLFGRLPRTTYGVESIPPALSGGLPPAYAQPNPADRSSSGILWVTGLPDKCPSYLHVPLVLHEGWPGHLMHIALIQEMDGLPSFRRFGAVKYTACVEGWALYCEKLGVELGLYTNPHEHYGRLEFEMWRAVRLVLDTGIHTQGWDRDRAIEYMATHQALSRATIESEVDRYIALPAQALAYQLGNLRIRKIRAHAQAVLGDRFSLRRFHDELTGIGAVTLPVLEELMEGWISRTRSTPLGR